MLVVYFSHSGNTQAVVSERAVKTWLDRLGIIAGAR